MKLYIVVNNELSPGAQIAQSVHAFREFLEEHPEVERKWYTMSNTIVILGADNEEHLRHLRFKGKTFGLKVSSFEEPDFNYALTAIVFEPSQTASEILADLKLAGSFTGMG